MFSVFTGRKFTSKKISFIPVAIGALIVGGCHILATAYARLSAPSLWLSLIVLDLKQVSIYCCVDREVQAQLGFELFEMFVLHK